jgi:hypothetical protein
MESLRTGDPPVMMAGAGDLEPATLVGWYPALVSTSITASLCRPGVSNSKTPDIATYCPCPGRWAGKVGHVAEEAASVARRDGQAHRSAYGGGESFIKWPARAARISYSNYAP